MDKRTAGIVATVVTSLLCGCPGVFSVCMGAFMAIISFVPGAEIDVFGSTDPTSALIFGIVSLCLGIIFVIIPIVVGFLTLRKKAEASAPAFNEPLPPAI